MKKYLFVLFLFVTGITHAQTIIKGKVSDENNKPLSDRNVTLREKLRAITLSYVMTDEDGKYKLEYNGKADSLVVTISGFNIRKQEKVIANQSQNLDFFVDNESITLNEVKIIPPKIRQTGDTLNYLVESFSDINDRTIGDVLKKMPGIKVQDNGAILYQNRPINKFYIENADLLQGRYGVATNNIDAKDVSTVQVLENHQPVKALKNKEFSEDAAINLKLKDSAKGTIIANAQVGLGAAPLLWNNELTGMYITKKLQNITTYKGNNSGDDVTRELTSFYSNDASGMSGRGLLSIQSPSAPSIREKRYLDNQANIISFNNLKSLKNDYQFTTNISYLNDYQQKNSYGSTEYYLTGDSILKIEEYLNSRFRKERLAGDIQLNANKEKFYFNNLLKFEGLWDRERGDILSQDSIRQYLKKPDFKINNTFNMVKTGEKYTWNIYSFNGYSSSDHTLYVKPVLYSEVLGFPLNSSLMIQNVEQRNFISNNKVSIGVGKGSFKQDYSVIFRADIQNLNSKLNTNEITDVADSLRNNIQMDKYELVFSPSYTYAKGRINAVLTLPFNYTILNIKNNSSISKNDESKLYFNPSLFLHYKMSGYWTSFWNYSYRNSFGSIDRLYTGYILASYRSLLRNDDTLFKQKSHNVSASVNYRNPLTTLFGMIHVNYFNNRTNLLYDYIYQGTLRVQTTLPVPNTTEGVNIDLNMSRDIESISSTVFLGSSYTFNHSSQITQGSFIDYSNQSYSVSPRIITKISPAINIHYEFRFSQNNSKIKAENKKFDPIRTISHNVALHISPMKGLSINLMYENFYNNTISSGNRSISFGDINAKFRYKQMEFMLDYTNIFNSGQFVSASYTDVSRYYSSYTLRPAEILLKLRFKLK